MNIILFGPPGAGKGTQADNIVKSFDLHKISTGDLLRDEISKKTNLGNRIKTIIEKGSFVSDEIINDLIEKILSDKKYISSLCIKIPNLPGKLGEVSSLIGFHENNIINMEIIEKKTDYLEFIFDIQVRDLKNYKNLISELKLKEYKFKIIRHRKKDAFLRRIFKNFKRN